MLVKTSGVWSNDHYQYMSDSPTPNTIWDTPGAQHSSGAPPAHHWLHHLQTALSLIYTLLLYTFLPVSSSKLHLVHFLQRLIHSDSTFSAPWWDEADLWPFAYAGLSARNFPASQSCYFQRFKMINYFRTFPSALNCFTKSACSLQVPFM